jgi:ABC-type phosphate/phosphonate transport system permease subunit
MVPPDLTPETIQRAMPKVMESLFVAWVGTMIAATISLPLGILAARNVAGSWSAGIRQLLILIRSVPELLLAMILIPVTGFGPWTGTLAIGLHSVGTLGKLSSEVVEGIDQGPVEAIAGAGGGRLAQIRFGIMPSGHAHDHGLLVVPVRDQHPCLGRPRRRRCRRNRPRAHPADGLQQLRPGRDRALLSPSGWCW